jgi:DNA-binding PadR family transcriptional regulator
VIIVAEAGSSEYIQVENKLILLYLIDKMDLPLSRSQITEFVSEGEYMDYYTLQQTLAEMVDGGYLEKAQDNNTTRYSVTDEGATTLEYFENHIPGGIRSKITKYVHDHFNSVKRDFEVTANYFLDSETNEYIVKCGVYEDKCILMEINVSVVSREQAKLIQNNWKGYVSEIYINLLNELVKTREAPEPADASKNEGSPDAPGTEPQPTPQV